MISACFLLSTKQRSSTISTSSLAKAEIFRMFDHLFNPLRLIINFITKSIDPKIVLSRFCHIKPHEAPETGEMSQNTRNYIQLGALERSLHLCVHVPEGIMGRNKRLELLDVIYSLFFPETNEVQL